MNFDSHIIIYIIIILFSTPILAKKLIKISTFARNQPMLSGIKKFNG